MDCVTIRPPLKVFRSLVSQCGLYLAEAVTRKATLKSEVQVLLVPSTNPCHHESTIHAYKAKTSSTSLTPPQHSPPTHPTNSSPYTPKPTPNPSPPPSKVPQSSSSNSPSQHSHHHSPPQPPQAPTPPSKAAAQNGSSSPHPCGPD